MKILDHFIRLKNARLRTGDFGPLRSLVLQQVPQNRLVTLRQVQDGIRDYLESHPGERFEIRDRIPHERIPLLVEQMMYELVEDQFLLHIPGRDIFLWLS